MPNIDVPQIPAINISWLEIGQALLTLVVCILVIRLVMGLVKRHIDKLPLDKTLTRFISSTIKTILYFVACLIIADKLGIPITSLLAVFSLVGLAFSLAIQDSLANLFCGLSILLSKPFKLDDYIQINGVEGAVNNIGLIYTRLVTPDNKTILVPNKETASGKIINFSTQATRRVDISINAGYDCDPKAVKEALLCAASRLEWSLKDPAPFAGVNTFESSAMAYVLRVWVLPENYWDAYFTLMEYVKEEFDKKAINIPFNQLDVHICDTQKGVAVNVAK